MKPVLLSLELRDPDTKEVVAGVDMQMQPEDFAGLSEEDAAKRYLAPAFASLREWKSKEGEKI